MIVLYTKLWSSCGFRKHLCGAKLRVQSDVDKQSNWSLGNFHFGDEYYCGIILLVHYLLKEKRSEIAHKSYHISITPPFNRLFSDERSCHSNNGRNGKKVLKFWLSSSNFYSTKYVRFKCKNGRFYRFNKPFPPLYPNCDKVETLETQEISTIILSIVWYILYD